MPVSSRRHFITPSGLLIVVLILVMSLIPAATAHADSAATELALDHVVVEGHLSDVTTFELGDLLAANSAGLGFFVADMPGGNAYDGGWAILDLNQLNAGPTTAVKHFQFEPRYYRAGGIASSGHFIALRYDARIYADGNRNDIVVYDVANPAAPTLFGSFLLEKTSSIWRITISDMVVYANRAYLLTSVLSTVPNQDFKGIIVVDLTSPDPTTKKLPEISRHASPILSMKLGQQGKLYGEDSAGNIYGYDLSTGLNLRGIYAAGSKFDLDEAYGSNAVIGRIQGVPTHVDFSAGPLPVPIVTTLQGEPFVTTEVANELLLANGRNHDLAVVWPEIVDAEGYAITVGSVDVSAVQASSVTAVDLTGNSFLLRIGSSELYKLRHDGWRPHVQLAANSPGILVNGQPFNQGTQVAIQSGVQIACSGQSIGAKASSIPAWPVAQKTGAVGLSTCSMAVQALCTDYTVINNIYFLAGFQAVNHCRFMAAENLKKGVSVENCVTENSDNLMIAYFAAVGKLCAKVWNMTPTSADTTDASALSGAGRAVVIHLSEGPLLMTTQDGDFTYAVESPLASVELSGRGSVEVLHDKSADTTSVRAVTAPVIVRPTNSSLESITLRPGEIMGVTSDRVLPVEWAGGDTHLPYLMR